MDLGVLASQFAALSLLAVGGANAVIPEMQRQAVDVNHWMSAAEFAELFAIAQAAPGPNVLVVTLIGWKVAGISGAVVATLAMCAPSCLLTLLATALWDRARHARWRAVVQAALGPITVGLVLASGYLLSRSAIASGPAFLVTAATTAVVLSTKIHPLYLLGAGAALGAAGWLPAL